MKKFIVLISVIAVLVYLCSCESVVLQPKPQKQISPTTVIHFKTSVYPLFRQYSCSGCHPSLHLPNFGPDTLACYNSLKTGGYVDTPAVTSKLYIKLSGTNHNGTNNFADSLEVIKAWINKGAPYN